MAEAGAGEDQAAPPRPSPHLDLNHPPMDEEAPAGKLRRLEHRHNVGDEPSFRMENLPEIFGDLSGMLANCSALEDLVIIECSGVSNLIIPHKLDKLRHLLIERMNVGTVEFHAAHLAHFEYKGREIPIVLRGCSKLEKAAIRFEGSKGLGRVFTLVPSILPAKILDVQADIYGYEQLLKLTTTRSHGMFTRLRHIDATKADNRVLQVAHCLNVAPQLETLHLDMIYLNQNGPVSHEGRGPRGRPTRNRRHVELPH